MKSVASQYAGVAAAFVFGIGLLMIGKTMGGIVFLGISVYWLGMMLCSEWSTRALLTAIAAIVWGGYLAWQATSYEITGKAVYWHLVGRVMRGEPVTREDSPAKFRIATNTKWALSIVCSGVSIYMFMIYRKSYTSESFY